MGRSKDLRRSLLGAAALSVFVAGPLGSARAEAPRAAAAVEVSIEASALGDALRAFSAQAGISVIFSERQVAGREAAALKGAYTPDAALRRLLDGTGLQAVRGEGGAYVLRGAAPDGTPGGGAGEDEKPGAPARVPQPDPEIAATELRAETVIVTGTSLRGLAPESSPLQVFTREEILGSGVTTTEQFIRTLPQNFGGGSTEFTAGGLPNDINSRQNFTFGTGANLRGLGSRGTLVLLDGNRLAPTSGIGDFVDLSLIPVSALDRVDVLTDGASSIYGGDAVAGVINFVLRGDYEGAETSLRYGSVTQGDMDEYRLSQTVGTAWEGGSVLGTYEYFNRGALSLADRPSIAAPELLNGQAITAIDAFDLQPEQKRHSAVLSLRQQLGTRLSLRGTGFYSRRTVDSSTVLASVASTITRSDTSSENIALNIAASYEISPQWQASVSANFSEVRNKEVIGSLVTPPRAPNVSDFKSRLLSLDALLNGDVMSVPGGQVVAAIGAQVRREEFDFQTRGAAKLRDGTRDVSALFGEVLVPVIGPDNAFPWAERLEVNLSGRVDDYSDFGRSANPKIGVLWSPDESLMIRGSYSTSFAPPALGRSGAIDRAGSVFPYSFILSRLRFPLPDPSLAGVDYLVTGGTQANLEPETSRAFTFGFDQAFSVGRHNWSVNGTFYDIAFEDRLGTTPLPQNLNSNFAPNIAFSDPGALPPGTVIFFPTQDEINALLATFTQPVVLVAGGRLSNIGIINNANVVRNLASTETQGLDLQVGYDVDTPLGAVSASLNANYLFGFSEQASATTPVVETVNSMFNPVDLKLRGRVGLSRAGFAGSLFVNYTDSYKTDGTAAAIPISSWTTVDLSLAYQFDDSRHGPFEGTRIGLSVTNLLDEPPPAAPASGLFRIAGYDPANASPLGRFVAIEISKSF
ncbi:TonB-dependent receptor [Hyphomonas sp.]|uniref:TonB-dependent receptor n=1 Tax=Hyphomonas sp. TaxID=87 RepID=UPI001D333352|nr:TonB-dependent receptor [Hyphomonas sp.]MBU4062330.1 TonB-dependent receptor [Alphaproteobacteria bacterium]MBU4162712.1 TonB-dependent receptor [Alphaproteobacteria bacterium]